MNSKKTHMISSATEIKKILKKGKHISGKYLRFIYMKHEAIRLELLISVPKKKIRRAVDRNNIKRKIKAFYFKKTDQHNLNGKVIIIYNHLKPVKYIKLEKDILLFENLAFSI